MKKVLGLLLLSSSLFSMEFAYKLQTPYNRFNRITSALVKTHKAKAEHIVSKIKQPISNAIDTPKVLIDESSIRTPHNLADVKLYHGAKGFVVQHSNGEQDVIEKRFMDQTARSITKEGLKYFLNTGYFALNKTSDGRTFTLKAHHRLTGGGPLFGAFMYWATKSLCYGTAIAAVGATAVTTAGVGVAVVSGGAAAGAGAAIATTIAAPAVITTTAGVGVATATTSALVAGTGATVVAGSIATAAGAGATVAGVTVVQAAALTTAAGVTAVSTTAAAASVGTGAACVMGIEALSTAVGTFFGMLPTP